MLRIGRRQGFMVAWVGTADPSPQKKSPRGSPVKNAFNSAILVYSEFEMKTFLHLRHYTLGSIYIFTCVIVSQTNLRR